MDTVPAEPVLQKGKPERKKMLRSERRRNAKKMALLYVFFAVPATLLFIFNYIPMYGVTLAFKEYRVLDGIIGSP